MGKNKGQVSLPPLSQEQYEALKASLKKDGQRVPILKEKSTGEIIDGAHRERACKELGIKPKYKAVEMSPEEVTRLKVALNYARRQMNLEQRSELIVDLRRGGYTQKQVGEMLGLTKGRISQIEKEVASLGAKYGSPLDRRFHIDRYEREEIIERVDAGETHEQVAADYGISRRRVGQIISPKERLHTKQAIVREEKKWYEETPEAGELLSAMKGFRRTLEDLGTAWWLEKLSPEAERFIARWLRQIAKLATELADDLEAEDQEGKGGDAL